MNTLDGKDLRKPTSAKPHPNKTSWGNEFDNPFVNPCDTVVVSEKKLKPSAINSALGLTQMTSPLILRYVN
jgi:hypothetical protein